MDETAEALNSDDDEEAVEKQEPDSVQKKSAAGWTEKSEEEFIDKTKCAFEFDNSVIFDLDE